MRRAGFIATLAAGVGLLGASLHGVTRMDHTLAAAAATPAPVIHQDGRQFVGSHHGRDCDRGGEREERRGPRV
jgi:hypothetical protein